MPRNSTVARHQPRAHDHPERGASSQARKRRIAGAGETTADWIAKKGIISGYVQTAQQLWFSKLYVGD